MGPLLRPVRTAEVAEGRTLAALRVHRELMNLVTRPSTSFDEQPVVLVDLVIGNQVHTVLDGVALRSTGQVRVLEPRQVPRIDDTSRRR